MRRVTAAVALMTSVISGVAAPLTPDQALARLRGSQSGLRMSGSTQYQLTYTENADGEDMLYVFNIGDKGFVIASADDRMPAKLGYSDSGAFDITTAPPQLKWWLEQYAQEAAYYFQNEDKYTFAGSRATTRAAIAPLVKTEWDQGSPYNLDCPMKDGEQCVTGCVATAMAQVIKYHGYPDKGTGTHSYSWNGTTLSYDYGAATFDYANMLDKYDGSATEEQQKAVANLMYACGVSVTMNYGPSSGTDDLFIPYA